MEILILRRIKLDMITYLQALLSTDDSKIIYILTLLMILMMVDFVMGVLIAKFDKDITFSSFKMKIGILMKIVEILLAIIAIPFALLFDVGLQLLYVLYIGLCGSELYSIFGHMKIVDDGDKGIDLLKKFFNGLFKKGDK